MSLNLNQNERATASGQPEINQPQESDDRDLSPKLRSDLIFRPQQVAGQTVYIVEDPIQTRFYRLGRSEYLLAASLDGKTTWREALVSVNHILGEGQLTEQQAHAILTWAAQNDLLESSGNGVSLRSTSATKSSAKIRASRDSLLYFRLPLGSPEMWIARCYPYLAWIYTKWATVAGVSIVALGLAALIQEWDRLVESSGAIFSPTGQVSLLISWVVLKAIHEMSHGLVCHRYGGTVRETGLQFIMLLPIAYVDVTSSWRIRSRWQRLHISAAGMQLELYVAGLAALAWSATSPGILNQFFANLVFMAGVTTIAFNANPLMRFDGYYILTDLIEMPNLAVTAQSWLRGWACHFFLGLPREQGKTLGGRIAFTRSYAVLAFVWRLFVCVGLIAAAATMLHGAGVVLAALAIASWFGAPLVRLGRLLSTPSAQVASMRCRLVTTCASLGLVSTVFLACLPWPGVHRAEGIVDYEPLTVVRTGVDGFVEQVFVRSGEVVQCGQKIARLRNDPLLKDHSIQKTKIEASQLRIRSLLGRRKLAALAAERQQLAALQTQLAELTQQVEGLTLRAPAAGRVVSRKLDDQVGVFFSQGDPLLEIGSDDTKVIVFSIPQRKISDVRASTDIPATIAVSTGERFQGRVERVEPRASVQPLDASLCTLFGGPLLAQHTEPENQSKDPAPQLELLEPHFTASVVLNAEQSRQLKAGQRATIVLGAPRESLGSHLWSLLSDHLLRSNTIQTL